MSQGVAAQAGPGAVHPLAWLRARDRGLLALRRAGRAALVMPGLFALGDRVIGNPQIALFATFGSFALLLLVDFGGPLGDRLRALAALAAVGAAFVSLGTAVSQSAWLAAATMAIVGFCVLFLGVISSVFASATVSMLLAFVLSASRPAPVSAIPDRLAGWGMASGGALLAVWLLWPAPARDPLRGLAAQAARALARQLREDGAAASRAAEESISALQRGFFASPTRPTGLSIGSRTLVRLVDELGWAHAVIALPLTEPDLAAADPTAVGVRYAAAEVLDRGGALLGDARGDPAPLQAAVAAMHESLAAAETDAIAQLPLRLARGDQVAGSHDAAIAALLDSLEPGFRAQELSFAVTQIAANIQLSAAAERRSWLQRALGRQPPGVGDSLSSTRERIGTHLERHSVWFHNSIRGAAGLAIAILIADLTGVQHSFWVVLGTLSVLRSSALNIGQNVVRAVVGTSAGVVVGALVLAVIGTNATLLWLVLPVAVLFAGIAPTAISFAAGQAAFTLVLVILYNILQPIGWTVGLLRVEDVAIGCAVSLGVGLLLWPRGAASALRQAFAEAYLDGARYLAAGVRFGLSRCDAGGASQPPPATERALADGAARRLDDAFRSYLAERGAKSVPLPQTTGLVTGTAALRLAAQAVLDLWQRGDTHLDGDRAAARAVLLESSARIVGWYEQLARGLVGLGEVPDPLPPDPAAAARLLAAVRSDLTGEDGSATATAVRMLWTANHLDAARRLQPSLVGPARSAAQAVRRARFDRPAHRVEHLGHGR